MHTPAKILRCCVKYKNTFPVLRDSRQCQQVYKIEFYKLILTYSLRHFQQNTVLLNVQRTRPTACQPRPLAALRHDIMLSRVLLRQGKTIRRHDSEMTTVCGRAAAIDSRRVNIARDYNKVFVDKHTTIHDIVNDKMFVR